VGVLLAGSTEMLWVCYWQAALRCCGCVLADSTEMLWVLLAGSTEMLWVGD
jgi:hypothetical protein